LSAANAQAIAMGTARLSFDPYAPPNLFTCTCSTQKWSPHPKSLHLSPWRWEKKKKKIKTNGESPTLQQGKEQCAIVAKQQNNYILSENMMFHKWKKSCCCQWKTFSKSFFWVQNNRGKEKKNICTVFTYGDFVLGLIKTNSNTMLHLHKSTQLPILWKEYTQRMKESQTKKIIPTKGCNEKTHDFIQFLIYTKKCFNKFIRRRNCNL
jgi:hypothetical protein